MRVVGMVLLGLTISPHAALAQNSQPRPSFDCSKATTGAASLICGDAELARLDAQLGKLFHDGYAARSGAAQVAFRNDEIKWIRERNKECGLDNKGSEAIDVLLEKKPCMLEAFQKRIAAIAETLSPPAIQAEATPNATGKSIEDALIKQFSGHQLRLRSVASIGAYALQDFTDLTSDIGGEALLKRDAANQWEVLKWSGGELSRSELVSAGIPEDIATPLRQMLVQAELGPAANAARPRLPTFTVDVEYERVISGQRCSGSYNSYNMGNIAANVRFANAETDLRAIFSSQKKMEFLNQVAAIIRQKCPNRQFDIFYVTVGNLYVAEFNGTWQERTNLIKEAEEAQARVNRRRAFMAQFNVQEIVDEKSLATNPFVLKSKIVGVLTSFRRMLSEGEALFFQDDRGVYALMAQGVPPTRFSNESPLILAVHVIGTKVVKTPNGDLNLPYGDFVGALECTGDVCTHPFDR